MALRATGRAAEDLLTLIRALKDPTELEGHLEKISSGSLQLADDIDAVKAREDAATQREAAAAEVDARQAKTSISLDDRWRYLDAREAMLKGQVENLEVAVRNHSAVVSDFEARIEDHREEVERRCTHLSALADQLQKSLAEHIQRKQTLDDREVYLNGVEAALTERARRIAEAVR